VSRSNGARALSGHPVRVEPPDRDAARALITARRAAASRARATTSAPFGSSAVALVVYRRRRPLIAFVAAVVAAILLLSAWAAGDGDVLTEQLEVFALSLLGVYSAGIAALAFWAHQRQRELVRLTDVERYVLAVAHRLSPNPEAQARDRREHR